MPAAAARPRLAGMEATCALGAGLPALDAALRAGAGGLRPDPDGTVLGRMPHRAWDGPGDPWAGLLAQTLAGACRDAGLDPAEVLADPATALVVATTKGDIAGLVAPPGATSLGPFLQRVRDASGHRGPAELVSAACASGSLALARAARLLERGACRRALVLAADRLDPFLVAGFRCLGALSPGACRPYDDTRDGLSLGEAAVAVLLQDDDAPGVRLAGAGQACDAFTMVRPCEDGSGLALAIRRALDQAGPAPVDGVCGHGTATEANDAMEAAAFRAALGPTLPPVFGLKGATGHTLGACGLLESVACALALRGGYLPATAGHGTGTLGLDVVAATRALPLRRLLTVNAGFGGLDVALVLDADTAAAPSPGGMP